MSFGGPAGNTAMGASMNSAAGAAMGGTKPPMDLIQMMARAFGFGSKILVWVALIGGLVFGVVRLGPPVLAWIGVELGEQGVDSVDDAGRVAKEKSEEYIQQTQGEWERQQALATGQSYESEVDENSEKDLGIKIEDIELDGSYKYEDPISAWAIISVGTIGEHHTSIYPECYMRDPLEPENKDYGAITPDEDEIRVYDGDNVELKCDFPRGTLKKENNEITFSLKYDFTTRSYMKATFMQESSLRNLRKASFSLLNDIEKKPITKNTEGPITIGIGSRDFPISFGNPDNIQPTVGFSLTNDWEGKIKEIKDIEIITPSSIRLQNCDSGIELQNPENKDGLNYYSLRKESLERLSDNMADDEDSYVSENFRCEMNIIEDQILRGVSFLMPVKKTIFVNINYTYEIFERRNIRVQDNEGFVVSFISSGSSSSGISRSSQVECTGDYYDGEISSCTYKLELIEYEDESNEEIIVEESQELNAVVTDSRARRCTSGTIFFEDESIFGRDIERGNTILCRMTMIPRYSEEDEIQISRYATVKNAVPEIKDIDIEPSSPNVNQDLECLAMVEDMDEDEITANFRVKVNGDEIRVSGEDYSSVRCSPMESPELSECRITIPSSETELNDYVVCEIIANDGLSSSGKDYAYADIIEDTSSGQEPGGSCTDTDGGIEISTRGTASGVDASGNPVSGTDECVDDSSVREYFCSSGIVTSQEYPCGGLGCYGGQC